MGKCQSVKRSKSEQLVSLNASHIPYTIPLNIMTSLYMNVWLNMCVLVYLFVCWTTRKFTRMYICIVGVTYSYVLGAYSHTNVLYNDEKDRTKEKWKQDRKKDSRIETEKGSNSNEPIDASKYYNLHKYQHIVLCVCVFKRVFTHSTVAHTNILTVSPT